MPAYDRADRDTAVESVRGVLDQAAFSLAWAEGRAMTLEQAVECVLKDETC